MLPVNSLNGNDYFKRGEGYLHAIFEKRILGDQYMSQPVCWKGIDETWLERLYDIVDFGSQRKVT